MDYIHEELSVKDKMTTKNAPIDRRLKLLINAVAVTDRKWKEMETATQIDAASWVDFYRGKKRASAAMVEAAAKAWPQYALWLILGIEEEEYGYLKPGSTAADRNSESYLKAALAEQNVALKILAPEYLDINPDGELDEVDESLMEKFSDLTSSAPQLISDKLDPRGEYRAAQARTRLEREQRRIEVSRLNEYQLAFVKATKGFPFVDKDEVNNITQKLIDAANEERKEFDIGIKQKINSLRDSRSKDK